MCLSVTEALYLMGIKLTVINNISEEIEREAVISLHENCPEETKKAMGLHLIEVDDALIAAAEHESSILINRTIGLGTKTPVETKALDEITSSYKKLGIDSYFLHIYEDDVTAEVKQHLSKVGLVKTRGWMKFNRDMSPPNDAPTTLTIERVGRDKANDFGRIVCTAFGMTDASVPLLAGLANDPRWYLYVSYEDGIAAGAGAMFVLGDSAFNEWGATNPEFRRRGSQSAIMAARIAKAIDLGCTHMFTETGEAVEGDAQHSYKNIMKHGFVETRLRENYEPLS